MACDVRECVNDIFRTTLIPLSIYCIAFVLDSLTQREIAITSYAIKKWAEAVVC